MDPEGRKKEKVTSMVSDVPVATSDGFTALFKAIRNHEKVKCQLCVMFVRHMTDPETAVSEKAWAEREVRSSTLSRRPHTMTSVQFFLSCRRYVEPFSYTRWPTRGRGHSSYPRFPFPKSFYQKQLVERFKESGSLKGQG